MKVCFIFRPKERQAHSIENVFHTVSSALEKEGVVTECYYRNKSFLKTLLEIRNLKADVYHITGDVHYMALFFPRSKTTITIHDIGAYKNNKRSLKQYVFALIWFILPIFWVKKLTVISQLVKSDLIAYFKINPKKIEIISNPLTLEVQFKKNENLVSPFKILQVGTGWHKNLIGLIEAAKGLDVSIHIIGSPSSELMAKMQEYNLSFTIYKNIKTSEVIELYESCDIVYFASFSEGFGLPILEAQKTGRPIITSNELPMNLVINNTELLVNPKSYEEIRLLIVKLFSDRDFYESCVEKGVKNVEKYNPKIIANSYLDFYKKYYV